MPRGDTLKKFNDTYFYNKHFVNKQLLDSQYVKKLMSVHNFVKPRLLFSDVVRNNKQTCPELTTKEQMVNNHPCVLNHNDQSKLNRGRIVSQVGKPVQNCTVNNVNTKVYNEQCVSHICASALNSIDKRMHVNNMQENQFNM